MAQTSISSDNPAGHDENLLGTHDPAEAAKAWDRAVSFLHQHLG